MNANYNGVPVADPHVEPLVPKAAAPPPAVGPGLTVRVLRTVAELEELRPVWTAWEGHPHSDLDFLLMLLESREEILSPYVVAVYRDGKPDAILVGRLEWREIRYRVGYLNLFKAKARGISFQYAALRGNSSDDNCREMILAILGSLRSGEADLATLHYPNTESFLYERALSVPNLFCRDFLCVPQPHHLMRLPATIEEVFQGLSTSHAKTLRAHGRKLEKKLKGPIELRCFREPADLEAGIPIVEGIARKTYHRGLGVGFEDDLRLRRMLEFHARNGQLRMFVLFDGDVPIAFWAGVVYGGWFHSDHTGFDPQYRETSPGTYLFVKMLENFCREGLQGVDFGLGDAQYKQRFGNQMFAESCVNLFAPRLKGLTIKCFQFMTAAASVTMKKVLSRTNLLPKLKRRWRDRLAQKGASSQD